MKDLRQLKLPKGVGELRFMDVASQIIPTSVHIKSLVRSRQPPRPGAELRVRSPEPAEAPRQIRGQGSEALHEEPLHRARRDRDRDAAVEQRRADLPDRRRDHLRPSGPHHLPRRSREPHGKTHARLACREQSPERSEGRGVLPHERHQLAVGLCGHAERQGRQSRPLRLGDHRQQERRDLPEREAQARGR